MRNIIKHRHVAFHRQGGFCCYCTLPIWENDPEGFTAVHGLTPAETASLRATAEHLLARCDGGSDTSQNIAAACYSCNKQRHEFHRIAPTAEDYFDYMLERVAGMLRKLMST